MTAIDGFKVVTALGRSVGKGLLDPAGAQRLALRPVTQPLLGQGVFQYHLAVGAAQHAEGHRSGLDHIAAEGFAFDQRLDAMDRRNDKTLVDAAHHQPDQRQAEQAEQQRTEQLFPQASDHCTQVDGVHQLPLRGLQVFANHQVVG